jgi:hypothetical protein
MTGIIPSPELVQQWRGDYYGGPVSGELAGVETAIATRAAQWGAEMELAACCRQLADPKWYDEIKNLRGPFRAAELRAARRPKPPSLAEEAPPTTGGTTVTQPLSPAAQVVKDAVLALYSDEKVHRFGWQLDAPTVAAALRALADQVVPVELLLSARDDSIGDLYKEGRYNSMERTRTEILAIAAELEGGR